MNRNIFNLRISCLEARWPYRLQLLGLYHQGTLRAMSAGRHDEAARQAQWLARAAFRAFPELRGDEFRTIPPLDLEQELCDRGSGDHIRKERKTNGIWILGVGESW
mgnify:CR=1 FL=1